METWKLLLITLLGAVLLGCLIGVFVGKHQLKVKRPGYKPLLSGKERIIYLACVLFGASCIAIGLLHEPPAGEQNPMGETGDIGGLITEDGMAMDGGMDGAMAEGMPPDGALPDAAADGAMVDEVPPEGDEVDAAGADADVDKEAGTAEATESGAAEAGNGEAADDVTEPAGSDSAAPGVNVTRSGTTSVRRSGGGAVVAEASRIG